MTCLDRLIASRVEMVAHRISRVAALEERSRILEIVCHGIDADDLRSALSLALTTELSAEDAIEIIDAKQSADDVIRAN